MNLIRGGRRAIFEVLKVGESGAAVGGDQQRIRY